MRARRRFSVAATAVPSSRFLTSEIAGYEMIGGKPMISKTSAHALADRGSMFVLPCNSEPEIDEGIITILGNEAETENEEHYIFDVTRRRVGRRNKLDGTA